MLKGRAVTLDVFRVSKHTGITHVLFVLESVLLPFCHFKKAANKVFALNPLNDFFAAVTSNFDRFDSEHLMERLFLWAVRPHEKLCESRRLRSGNGWHIEADSELRLHRS